MRTSILFMASLMTPCLASFDLIAGYEPTTQVTDANAMDLDMQLLKGQLDDDDATVVQSARSLYAQGGHSQSFADISLADYLSMDLPSGTEVSGTGVDGSAVRGYLQLSHQAGATTLQVHYATGDSQATYLNCRVGALPVVEAAVKEGCFAENGIVSIDGMSDLQYTYNALTDNRNSRTIQSFSTKAKTLYYDCEQCPYVDYAKFVDYYGEFDYSNQFIDASLSSTGTVFARGNVDFAETSSRFREAFTAGAAVTMSFFMKVIGDMEDAIDKCPQNCESASGCNVDGSNSWDRAVAFYTGSLEGTAGTGSGLLLYTLADQRCINFKTCFAGNSGISNVNRNIINEFVAGQFDANNGSCSGVRPRKERIAKLMLVPLIQQTLHRAFLLDEQGLGFDVPNGPAMVAAASILPYVHACSIEDAATIYQNMAKAVPSFATVKTTLERNYECMGIRCVDVGGLYSGPNEEYYVGAEPCIDNEVTAFPSSGPPTTPEPTTVAPTFLPTGTPTITAAPSANSMPPSDSPTTNSSGNTVSVCLAAILLSALSVFNLFN